MSIVAHNIKTLRLRKQLSQEGLADAIEATRSRIGSYEESRSEPNIKMLMKLADFFEITIDDLVRDRISFTKQNSI